MEPASLLLRTLVPDMLQAIIRLSCDGIHSEDTDAAASAQDTAAALRLTCRTLRAAVNRIVKQLTMRVTSLGDISKATKRFPGVDAVYIQARLLAIDMTCRHSTSLHCRTDAYICRAILHLSCHLTSVVPSSRSTKGPSAHSKGHQHHHGLAKADAMPE
jgi:hypothetical protein